MILIISKAIGCFDSYGGGLREIDFDRVSSVNSGNEQSTPQDALLYKIPLFVNFHHLCIDLKV